MSTRIPLRKLKFLCKLLCPKKDTLSSRTFSSLAIDDVYNTSIVQQCLMLESYINTTCTAQCLKDPDNSLHTFKYMKSKIVDKDFNLLISSSLSQHVSVRLVAAVAESSSWRCLWDIALDKGVKGTRTMQFLFKELCRPAFQNRLCKVCNISISANTNCFEHACQQHPSMTGGLSCNEVISTIKDGSADTIFSTINLICGCKSLWY